MLSGCSAVVAALVGAEPKPNDNPVEVVAGLPRVRVAVVVLGAPSDSVVDPVLPKANPM